MSNNSTCIWTDRGLSITSDFRVVIYRYLIFVYILIGCTSHIILLAAFYKQSKTEKAYGYQVIYSVSKTLEIFFFGTFLFARLRLDYEPFEKTGWLHQNYIAMEIFGHLGFTLHLTFIICSLLLAVVMAADRVFAMTYPAKYLKISHIGHQIASTVGCFLVGLCGGGIYLGAVQIKWAGSYYITERDVQLDTSLIGVISENVRLISRVGGVALLLCLDTVMIVLFKRRAIKVETMVAHSQDQTKTAAKKAKERSLLWIVIYQACSMLLNQFPHVTWVHILPRVAPEFRDCYGSVIGPACDVVVMITDTLDFFIVIAINRKMRKLVLDILSRRSAKVNQTISVRQASQMFVT